MGVGGGHLDVRDRIDFFLIFPLHFAPYTNFFFKGKQKNPFLYFLSDPFSTSSTDFRGLVSLFLLTNTKRDQFLVDDNKRLLNVKLISLACVCDDKYVRRIFLRGSRIECIIICHLLRANHVDHAIGAFHILIENPRIIPTLY